MKVKIIYRGRKAMHCCNGRNAYMYGAGSECTDHEFIENGGLHKRVLSFANADSPCPSCVSSDLATYINVFDANVTDEHFSVSRYFVYVSIGAEVSVFRIEDIIKLFVDDVEINPKEVIE